MEQPVSNPSTLHEPGLFKFTSRLEFEAKCNLLRSRSDTCLGKHRSRSSKILPEHQNVINPWTVPFTFQRCIKPKYLTVEARIGGHRRNQTFMKIPVAKALETSLSKEIPLVTSFRSASARAARIVAVREGTHPTGPYSPLGPHAFRGDDFRPDSGIRNNGKPPFLTTYPRDPGNLELLRKSISAHGKSVNYDEVIGNKERRKPFLTSTKRQPKWDNNLILTKEKYQRGTSEQEIQINRILKQLPWYSREPLHTPKLDRPDIKDYKTVDWLQVTQHSKDETTRLS